MDNKYKEMLLRIEWLESLVKLNQAECVKLQGELEKQKNLLEISIDDNQNLISKSVNLQYFIGITKSAASVKDMMQFMDRIQEQNGRIAALENQIAIRDEQIQKLQSTIAEEKEIVTHVFNERGAGRRKRDGIWQERYHRFCELYEQGYKNKQICEMMNISASTCTRFKRVYKDRTTEK